MILVVCALAQELRHYIAPAHVRILAVGVGPVEAAIGTARALATDRFTHVVNAGIGGVFRGFGHVGDAFAIGNETLADFGLEGGGAMTLPGGATLQERADADAALLSVAGTLALPIAAGLTVAQVTTTDATAARLQRRYDVAVESMEGFSVLRAAADAGIPAVEVRGISNYVGDRDHSAWDFDAGARATARVLAAIVSELI
jgi:futalosine hydrolase